jgi:NAD-dependent SIR2 family protein deacetylase
MKQKTLNQWSVHRTRPYTQKGIRRLRCIRCGNPAEYQWQICADGNNYRPICGPCDVELNTIVLYWMRHPQAKELMKEYEHGQ